MADSEAKELRRQTREAERQRQKERQEAERLHQEAKHIRQETERIRQETARLRQEREAMERQTRHTTLIEYLAACHHHVFARLAVETNPAFLSRAVVADPQDRLCPTRLEPWVGFLDQQKAALGTLHSAFPADEARVFDSQHFLAGMGDRIAMDKISDEQTLERFQHEYVHHPVQAVMKQLEKAQEAGQAFDMGDSLVLENGPHALADVSDGVISRQGPPSTRLPSLGNDPNYSPILIRPYRTCVYRLQGNSRSMVYLSESKPPYKLTPPHLRMGLRPMEIHRDVVNREPVPASAGPDAQFQYYAERLTAAAATQTYRYMIEDGLEYGLLTTGEATVFFRVDWRRPDTLLYHLAEPAHEVAAHGPDAYSCTATAQYLAFVLMALGPPGERKRREHGQDERRQARAMLRSWAVDFEAVLRSAPKELQPTGSAAHEPRTYKGVDRWPRPKEEPLRSSSETLDGASASARQDQPAYCTQACLLGLVQGTALDQQCPNVALHSQGAVSGSHHPVSHAEWLQLLYRQLENSLDDGIVALGKGGSRGVLFRVTLLRYGYTLVSKGTVSAFVPDLQHESRVYERLQSVQGTSVPVFLGAVDLREMNKVYYYDHRVYVVFLILLSWAGHGLRGPEAEAAEGGRAALAATAVQALSSIHQEGVLHGGVKSSNALFSPETGGVMFVDLERSELLERPQQPLEEGDKAQQFKRERERAGGMV